MAHLEPVLADLTDEGADLDAIVAELADADWATETPAPGWTIAHQIAREELHYAGGSAGLFASLFTSASRCHTS